MASRYLVATADVTWSTTTTADWSASDGGASGAAVPVAGDDVYLTVNSAHNLTVDAAPPQFRSLDCTGFTHTLTHSTGVTITLGAATSRADAVCLAFSAVMTYTKGSTSTSAFTFASTSGTRETITCNTNTIASPTFNGVGGKWKLLDRFTMAVLTSTLFTLTAGDLDLNGQIFDIPQTSMAGATAHTLRDDAGGAVINVNRNAAVSVWDSSGSGITLSLASSTIKLPTATNTRTVKFGTNQSIGTIDYSVGGSTGQLTLSYTTGLTVGTLKISDGSNARTVSLPSSTTLTVTTFNVNGSSGNLISIIASSAGTAATISKSSGTVSCDYLSLKDSAATGGASFYAGGHSTNVSGNSGWTFSAPPSSKHISAPTMMSSRGGLL